MTLKEEDKGQITNPELAKRELPINGEGGLDTQIKMHNGQGTDMKWSRIYEIEKPSS